MDPEATFKALLDALAEKDWDLVGEHAYNLIQWIDRGGFFPEVEGLTEDEIYRRLVGVYAAADIETREWVHED